MSPPFEDLDRNQDALYWPFIRYASDGEVVVGEFQEISVRWEHIHREIMDDQGETVVASDWVQCNFRPPIGSLMFEGTSDYWVGTGSNVINNGLVVVIGFEDIPSISARFTHYGVFCMRYGDQLPTVEA